MNNEKFFNLDYTIGLFSDCDVVLTYENELYIGLKYDEKECNAPIEACKGGISIYERKIIEMLGIPCVENKALVRSLLDDSEVGEEIPNAYWKAIANIYSKLSEIKEKKEETEFETQLREDVQAEIYMHEKDTYKKVIRNFSRLKTIENNFEGNVARYFEEEIRNLTAEYELNTRSYHNSSFMTDEFCLETCCEKYDIKFRQMVFICEKGHKIYIGGRSFFMTFNFEQAESAIKFLILLVKTCNEKLKPMAKDYFEEFDINPRIYELVSNSIKPIVELNYKLTGQEYGLSYDRIRFTLVIKKKEIESAVLKPRMFLITITYKEYLRDSKAFKEFIKDPKPMKKWNFWCREQKYNPELFDEKFQTITP